MKLPPLLLPLNPFSYLYFCFHDPSFWIFRRSNKMENGNDLPFRGSMDSGLRGRTMMVLFFVVIAMVCVHLYARWYLLRSRRRRRRRRLRRRHRMVFTMDTHNAEHPSVGGLDAAVIKSLPIFAYSSKTHPEPIDCSVCLSEFGENEAGRVLPKCNHSFHMKCIDMWFHSHSTCPLCRTPVERSESSGEVFIVINRKSFEPGSSSGSCKHNLETPVNMANPSSSLGISSFGARNKQSEMASLDIPRRNENSGRFENESEYNTPVTSLLRSPISRMVSHSFRILGRERRGVSPSGNAVVPFPVGPPDVERGGDEIERH